MRPRALRGKKEITGRWLIALMAAQPTNMAGKYLSCWRKQRNYVGNPETRMLVAGNREKLGGDSSRMAELKGILN
jgi:hypothetical protein